MISMPLHRSRFGRLGSFSFLAVLFGLLLLPAGSVHAQEHAQQPVKPFVTAGEDTLTFDAARLQMLSNHPDLRKTEAEMRARRRDADADAQFPNPSLTVSEEWTDLEPAGIDDQWYLNVAQPLRYPGEHAAYRRRADATARVETGYVTETRAQLYRELRRHYLDVVGADARREVHERFSDAIRTAARAAEIRYEEGDMGTFQRARLRAARAEAENRLSDAMLRQRTSRTVLLAFLRPGMTAEDGEKGSGAFIHEAPVDTLFPVAGRLEDQPVQVDLPAAQRRAGTERGLLEATRAEVDVAGQMLRATRYQQYPRIQITAGPKQQRLPGATTYGYTAGITIGLPLWNTGRANVDANRNRQAAARAEQDVARRTVDVQVQNATARVRNYRERLDRLQATDTDPNALLEDALFVYREGEIQLFELLDAVIAARETALLRIQLIEAYLKALHDLEFAIGIAPDDRPLLVDGALDIRPTMP